MPVSQKFKYIEENLTNILYTMVTNQNLLRYISYLDDDPLDPSKPDITSNLIGTQIMLIPFDLNVLTKQEINLFINPVQGDLSVKRPIGTHTFIIDIVVPNKFWLLKGKIRAFRIADEIASNIDGLNIAGIGWVEINRYKIYSLNNAFSSLSLFVDVGGVTVKA